MAKLTVIVHTKNSAAILDRCLKSVKPLSDELLVVDMASTDNTRQIARSYGAKIIKHPDVGLNQLEITYKQAMVTDLNY